MYNRAEIVPQRFSYYPNSTIHWRNVGPIYFHWLNIGNILGQWIVLLE